jgi:autotransporter passenger strand-loop-strand repeat protein
MTTQFVSSGVVNSGVIVSGGNVLEVLSGGTADATTVTSGGDQQVDSGGFASGTVISAGGSDTVFGTDTGATVNSGGTMLLVGRTPSASNVTISSGGTVLVEGRGSVTNVTINSGGTLVDANTFAALSGVVDNGTLAFDHARVDLNVASGSGVIEVTDGANVFLSLTSASNFTGGFVVSSGGLYGGGNLVLTSAGAALGLPIDLAAPDTQLRTNDTVMPSDVIRPAAARKCCPATCCRSPRAGSSMTCNSIRR